LASLFGHITAATAIGLSFFQKQANRKSLILAAVCSVIPDADVLGFKLGISYGDPFGHRGASHSILFALVLGTSLQEFFIEKIRNF